FRIPKNLFTDNADGERISLFSARDETDEAHFIALTAKSRIEDGTPADEIAVLYRANFQSRALEEAFLAYGVPYQLLGTKFFERKEVKDGFAYVRAALERENASDFLRIVNVPARGIGKTTIEKIATGREAELPAGTQAKISAVRTQLLGFREKLLAEPFTA